MKFRTLLPLLAVVSVLSVGLVACGGDDDASSNGGNSASKSAGAQTTLQLAANPGGVLEYDKAQLGADAGTVGIDLTNESSTPHDVVVETKDGEKLANTEIITQSEDSLSVDLKPGEYTFYCSVPGHRDAGMEGELTVE